jgi:hypothetical protein
VNEGVAVAESVGEAVSVGVAVAERVGDKEADCVAVRVALPVAVIEGEGDLLGLTVFDGESPCVAEGL